MHIGAIFVLHIACAVTTNFLSNPKSQPYIRMCNSKMQKRSPPREKCNQEKKLLGSPAEAMNIRMYVCCCSYHMNESLVCQQACYHHLHYTNPFMVERDKIISGWGEEVETLDKAMLSDEHHCQRPSLPEYKPPPSAKSKKKHDDATVHSMLPMQLKLSDGWQVIFDRGCL